MKIGKLDVAPTKFLGYDFVETEAIVEAVLAGDLPNELNIVLDRTALYAEMGGQVGRHADYCMCQDMTGRRLDNLPSQTR